MRLYINAFLCYVFLISYNKTSRTFVEGLKNINKIPVKIKIYFFSSDFSCRKNKTNFSIWIFSSFYKISDLSPSPLPSPSLLAELGCLPLLPLVVSSGNTSSLLCTVNEDLPFFPKPSLLLRPSSPTHVSPIGTLWFFCSVFIFL